MRGGFVDRKAIVPHRLTFPTLDGEHRRLSLDVHFLFGVWHVELCLKEMRRAYLGMDQTVMVAALQGLVRASRLGISN